MPRLWVQDPQPFVTPRFWEFLLSPAVLATALYSDSVLVHRIFLFLSGVMAERGCSALGVGASVVRQGPQFRPCRILLGFRAFSVYPRRHSISEDGVSSVQPYPSRVPSLGLPNGAAGSTCGEPEPNRSAQALEADLSTQLSASCLGNRLSFSTSSYNFGDYIL